MNSTSFAHVTLQPESHAAPSSSKSACEDGDAGAEQGEEEDDFECVCVGGFFT
jgi:hypothetical protein